MTIHLKGGDIGNRGDVLMLRTVVSQLRKANQPPRLSVHNHFVPFEMRSHLGLRHTLWFPNFSRLSGLVGYPVLKRYRETLGITLPEEIDWVLDLSGFCYTDQWGPQNAVNMRDYLEKQQEYDTKYVILPQAFGPFQNSKLAHAFKSVSEKASIIFVRDKASKSYVEGLGVESKTVKAPDLTTIAPSEVPSWCGDAEPYFCIVPNSRMIEEPEEEVRTAYVEFVAQAYKALSRKAGKVIFLLFEERDRALLKPVCETLGHAVAYLDESDPVRLRGVIGEAQGVVASRYHALISALSQGVCALGTSWSHKYEELFADYECEELLVSNIDDSEGVQSRLNTLIDSVSRAEWSQKIEERASVMRNRASKMWARIGKTVGLDGIDRVGEQAEHSHPKQFDVHSA